MPYRLCTVLKTVMLSHCKIHCHQKTAEIYICRWHSRPLCRTIDLDLQRMVTPQRIYTPCSDREQSPAVSPVPRETPSSLNTHHPLSIQCLRVDPVVFTRLPLTHALIGVWPSKSKQTTNHINPRISPPLERKLRQNEKSEIHNLNNDNNNRHNPQKQAETRSDKGISRLTPRNTKGKPNKGKQTNK